MIIVIPDMPMPTSCRDCRFWRRSWAGNLICLAMYDKRTMDDLDIRQEWCPMHEKKESCKNCGHYNGLSCTIKHKRIEKATAEQHHCPKWGIGRVKSGNKRSVGKGTPGGNGIL